MKQLLLIAGACFLASCVKLEVKPEGLVSDTVDAGKSIYKTVKGHTDGLQERTFSYSVHVAETATLESTLENCRNVLLKQIDQASKNEPQILSEESSVSEDQKVVTCSAKAMI